MKSFKISTVLIVTILVLSGCSRDDFDLSKIASTTISGFGEKLGNLSLSGIGEQIGIKSDPIVNYHQLPFPSMLSVILLSIHRGEL